MIDSTEIASTGRRSCPSWCREPHLPTEVTGYHHDGEPITLSVPHHAHKDEPQKLYVYPSQYVGDDGLIEWPAVDVEDTDRTLARLTPIDARRFAAAIVAAADLADGGVR